MKILIFLTFLALSTAHIDDFRKFTAKFFTGVGITEDINFINKCITEAEEMAWESIYMALEMINWYDLDNVLLAVAAHATGDIVLLTQAYMCAIDKVKVKAIIDKINNLMENEQKVRAKVAANMKRIEEMIKEQINAKKAGDFEKAGTIAANFVKWFFLSD